MTPDIIDLSRGVGEETSTLHCIPAAKLLPPTSSARRGFPEISRISRLFKIFIFSFCSLDKIVNV